MLREEEEEEEEEAEEAEDEEEEGEEEYACWVLSETFLGSAVWQKMDEWGHLSEIIIFTSVILSNYLGRRFLGSPWGAVWLHCSCQYRWTY